MGRNAAAVKRHFKGAMKLALRETAQDLRQIPHCAHRKPLITRLFGWQIDCTSKYEMNFDQAPLIVIWETTQACDLACAHCRASAAPQRHRSELTTGEAYRLLDQIREFGT